MIDYCYRSEVQNQNDAESSNDSKVIKAGKNYNNYIASIVDSRPDSVIHHQFSPEDELTAEDVHRLLLDTRKYTKQELKMLEEEITQKYSKYRKSSGDSCDSPSK